jgi:hypothetical protein
LYASHLISGRPCPVSSGAISVRNAALDELITLNAVLLVLRRRQMAPTIVD